MQCEMLLVNSAIEPDAYESICQEMTAKDRHDRRCCIDITQRQ